MLRKLARSFLKKMQGNNKSIPIAVTPIFDAYRRMNEENFRFLTKDNNGSMNQKKLEATQRYNEFLWRLDQRYQRLKSAELFICHTGTTIPRVAMNDIQLEFVNCIEAYYEQLYASLSAFAMFLNHVSSPSFKRGLPIGSIEKFLGFLRNKTELKLNSQLVELENSRYFRSKFVIHVQQHTLHNWMTFSYLTEAGPGCAVIYYIKRGPEVYFRTLTNPHDPDFQPPVNYESFYVSPPHNECHQALFDVCQRIISHISRTNSSV